MEKLIDEKHRGVHWAWWSAKSGASYRIHTLHNCHVATLHSMLFTDIIMFLILSIFIFCWFIIIFILFYFSAVLLHLIRVGTRKIGNKTVKYFEQTRRLRRYRNRRGGRERKKEQNTREDEKPFASCLLIASTIGKRSKRIKFWTMWTEKWQASRYNQDSLGGQYVLSHFKQLP